MYLRRRFHLMNEVAEVPTGAPAAAPAAPTPAPAAPAPAPVEPSDSLLTKPPTGTPAPAPADPTAPVDELAWLPEKYRVNGADGKVDMAASSKKLGEGYGALAKKLGGGEGAPAAAADYKFAPTEALKDVKLDDTLSGKFRDRAHKLGLSQSQYQGVLEAHLEMVPEVLNATLKLSAEEARSELSKVWTGTAEFEKQLSNAQRAVDSAPEGIREDLWARFGRDPAFIQFAARMGSEMREDKPNIERNSTPGAATEVEGMMQSEAYRNPKHADHARVSAAVTAHFQRVHGSQPAM
jgi:hypothetical protein